LQASGQRVARFATGSAFASDETGYPKFRPLIFVELFSPIFGVAKIMICSLIVNS
jgi:hypothetical protein